MNPMQSSSTTVLAARGAPRLLLLAVLAVASPFGCGTAADSTEPAARAQSFVAALNATDPGAMAGLVELPFTYRTQEWAATDDGFGLLAAEERSCDDRSCLDSLLAEIVQNIAIENPAVADTLAQTDARRDVFLAGAATQWSVPDVFAFVRGEGDVEHTALVAVGPGGVRGFYVN